LESLKNQGIQNYLEHLSATEPTDYSLWKATRKIKQPQTHTSPIKMANGSWARDGKDKARSFAEHLVTVFQPFPSESSAEEETIFH
jgi:hypothetical protein